MMVRDYFYSVTLMLGKHGSLSNKGRRFVALKGRNMKAWGNAPGLGITKTRALKGRNRPKALYRPRWGYKINPSFS
jgi:hypothetical protein